MAFNMLPCMALAAKIIPKGLEGTLYAFITGIMNLDTMTLQPLVGNFINVDFVGVT